jgi:hypothetical protein
MLMNIKLKYNLVKLTNRDLGIRNFIYNKKTIFTKINTKLYTIQIPLSLQLINKNICNIFM